MKKLSIFLAFLIIGGISSTLSAQARVTVSADPDGHLSGQCGGLTNVGNDTNLTLDITNVSKKVIGNFRAENPKFRFDVAPRYAILNPSTYGISNQNVCDDFFIGLFFNQSATITLNINIVSASQTGCGTFTADVLYDYCDEGEIRTKSVEISHRVYAYRTSSSPNPQDDFPIKKKTTLNISPNPFSDFTNLQYNLPADMSVKITLFDIYGRERKVLLNGMQYAGQQNLSVDGIGLEKGTYFCIIETATFRKVEKLIKN